MSGKHSKKHYYFFSANFIFSWLALPFLISPFNFHSIKNYFLSLGMCIGIQAAALVAWPLAVVMSFVSGGTIKWADLAWLLMYPALTFFLIRFAVLKNHTKFDIISLHFLITLSFGRVWHSLIYGFDLMVG